MKILWIILIPLSLLFASCGYPVYDWGYHYSAAPSSSKEHRKPIKIEDVIAVKQTTSLDRTKAYLDYLRYIKFADKKGYSYAGSSTFTGRYGDEIHAKGQAANIGCGLVRITRTYIGPMTGQQMVLAAYTPPSIGVSTLTSGYTGNTYTSTYYNPGQSVYTPQSYTYDGYLNHADFFYLKSGQ